GPELLGVAVARVDLEQPLAVGVVHLTLELLVERAAPGGVEAPRGAVRDHHALEAPLRELLEEHVGRLGGLVAVDRELARVDPLRAEGNGDDLLLESAEVEVALAVGEIEEGELEALPDRRALGEGLAEETRARADRPLGHAVLGRLA